MAPALTIGLVRPSGRHSMAANELKADPVAIRPELLVVPARRRCDWQTNAKMNGLDTLMIEKCARNRRRHE